MKKMLSVTLAAAMALSLAGCGGGSSKDSTGTTAAPAGGETKAAGDATTAAEAGDAGNGAADAGDKEPVTITFWHRDGNTTSNPIYAEVIKKFQEKYPWITVEYTGLASDSYTQKFNSAVL